jgi:hypothetical protein
MIAAAAPPPTAARPVYAPHCRYPTDAACSAPPARCDTRVLGSYSCVPQSNRPTQELAISSISVYASRAHAFVAVVPPCDHQDTGEACTGDTYQRRLWTRAELLMHLLINGTETMWVANGPRPGLCEKMPSEWLRGSTIRVFGGQVRARAARIAARKNTPTGRTASLPACARQACRLACGARPYRRRMTVDDVGGGARVLCAVIVL